MRALCCYHGDCHVPEQSLQRPAPLRKWCDHPFLSYLVSGRLPAGVDYTWPINS